MLLTEDEPSPVRCVNPAGRSSFLLLGDHAGNRIPQRLGTLGLDVAERERHIAWDIGVAALGERLADALDAVFLGQTYSRLVIDCNRVPAAPDAMPAVSDGTTVPGNADLDDRARAARVAAIHAPYQAAIAAELARRDAAGLATILVALHSFTPRMRQVDRPWQIGILHDGGDAGFAHACLAALREDRRLTVGDNEPYTMDGTDYTIPRHAFAAGRRYVEIEVRQDLMSGAAGIAEWAGVVERMLRAAAA